MRLLARTAVLHFQRVNLAILRPRVTGCPESRPIRTRTYREFRAGTALAGTSGNVDKRLNERVRADKVIVPVAENRLCPFIRLIHANSKAESVANLHLRASARLDNPIAHSLRCEIVGIGESVTSRRPGRDRIEGTGICRWCGNTQHKCSKERHCNRRDVRNLTHWEPTDHRRRQKNRTPGMPYSGTPQAHCWEVREIPPSERSRQAWQPKCSSRGRECTFRS